MVEQPSSASEPNPARADLKLEELFDAAMDLSPAEQLLFLQRECAGDSALRRDLEELLMADRDPAAMALDAKAIDAFADTTDSESVAGSGASVLPGAGDKVQQYQIIRELGRGGMGTVFLARDTKLARRVAIKFLSGATQSPHRFIVEARATARCTHENIVVIHEVSEYRGVPFMVLEYVQGQTLRRLARRQRISPQRAVELLVPVVRALHCAHEQDIVHRDLKPENIIVTETGAIKVLDFGIAKLRAGEPGGALEPAAGAPASSMSPSSMSLSSVSSSVSLSGMSLSGVSSSASVLRPPEALVTHTGTLLGTLPYMSPEQWRGADDVDHQTDIWAVGIMLYELIVGRHPLNPQGPEDLAVTCDLDTPMPSARAAAVALPGPLAQIIDDCLHKRKEQRTASAHQLLERLASLLPTRRQRNLAASESPYPGLLSFQEGDSHRYFGRSRDIGNALARIRHQPIVGIAGPTGIGKSSFVRAGLIPALRDSGESWESVVVRPGRAPFSALANALVPMLTASGARALEAAGDAAAGAPDSLQLSASLARRLRQEPGYLGTVLRNRARERTSKILLIVDPLEELYTLSADADERKAFTVSLAGAADDGAAPVRVLVSIRSDFLDRVAEDPFFMTELTAGLIFLAPPGRDSLREALIQPARMAGYEFESEDMVAQIITEVEVASGSLPLLQFAATELWAERDERARLLTEQSYRDLGGIVGALASHADEVVRALSQTSPRAKESVGAIMRRLVTPERTRALASMSELRQLSERPEEVSRILDRLVEARLLVVHSGDDAAGATVELIHDALIHSWPQLRRFLDESADDAAFLEHARTVAKQWAAKGRPPGLLWRGETMDEARLWHRRYRGHVPPLVRDYLQAAFALADRSIRRRRLAVAATMGLLVLVAAAALFALVQIRKAEHQATRKAEEAEQARAQVETQLDVVRIKERERQAALEEMREKERARLAAETRAEDESARAEQTGVALDQTTLALQDKVVELELARKRAEAESRKARQAQSAAEAAREDAERAADKERTASAALDARLAEERALREKLERKVGKLNRTLK